MITALGITGSALVLFATLCALFAALARKDRLTDVDAPTDPPTPDHEAAYLAWLDAALTPWWRSVLAAVALEETSE